MVDQDDSKSTSAYVYMHDAIWRSRQLEVSETVCRRNVIN